MKLTYDQVKNEIESEGWTLLSTNYHNLKALLELKCPNGHLVNFTLDHWRRHKTECPICSESQHYHTDMSAPHCDGTRVLAIDQATNVSGWSIFDNNKLIKFGTYTTKQLTTPMKISEMKGWLAGMTAVWKPTIVILEDIHLHTNGGTENVTVYKTLAHLQGVLINYCVEHGIKYSVCSASTWRNYSNIRGKSRVEKKKSAQIQIQGEYNLKVSQDEADAILIGKWGAAQQ